MQGWPAQVAQWQNLQGYISSLDARNRGFGRQRQACNNVSCSATTLSFGWVDRTGEVSTSGNGAGNSQNGADRQGRRPLSKAFQPVQQRRDQEGDPAALTRNARDARTMQELAKVLAKADLRDAPTAVAAVAQLPHVLRSAHGRSRKAALVQHPLFGSLTQAALEAVPSADLQGLVALVTALAELDEFSADAHCMQALMSAAERLTGVLHAGRHVSVHCLCQVVAAVAMSKTLQKSFKPLMNMCITALEPQLDRCRPQDLCTLAAELCNLGLYVQHAVLVRSSVERALSVCDVIPARELASLAHACGTLRNVPKVQMLELAGRLEAVAGQLRPRSSVMVLQAFAAYRVPVPGLASALAESLDPHLSGLSPTRFSLAAAALAKLGHRPRGRQAQRILAEMDRRLEGADARSQASLFWAMSKMGLRPSEALLDKASVILQQKELRAQASQRQSLLTPRNLSAIIWAWGTFGYAPLAMPFLLEVTEARMQQSNDQDLANIMLGLASCEQPRLATPSLMRAAEQHACSIAASFSPQGLANTLWAFAKLEQPAPRFCRAAAAEVGRRLGSFSLRDLSQILWSFAKLEHRHSPAAVSLIADHTTGVLTAEGLWAMRDVAQMTWALGVLEQPELPFIAACQHAAGRRMAQASVVDVINLMWGYARLGVPLSGPCMQMHTARVGELAAELAPHQLSTVLWALGKLQAYPGIEVMETLLMRSRLSLPNHPPQGVSSMAQACAALRHHPGELLDAVAADVEARPSDYDRDEWTNIVWALTRLGRFPGHLYALLAQEVDEGRISLDATLMSTVIWSLALFRQFESPLYDDILRGLKQWDIGQFDQESLRRLYQAHLLSGALRRKAAASLPPEFLREGRRLWLEALDADSEPGVMLVDVSEALARVGLENQRAAIVGRGTFKMDVALRQLDKDGHPVAIEIITPHKMTRNTHQPVSRVLYRNACLKAWGYTIVPVLGHDWMALGKNSWRPETRSAKENFLLQLLTPVLHGEAVREKVLSPVMTSAIANRHGERER